MITVSPFEWEFLKPELSEIVVVPVVLVVTVELTFTVSLYESIFFQQLTHHQRSVQRQV